MRTANSFHVNGDDKYTRSLRSVQCIVFIVTRGKIPSIREMTMDEYGLISMEDIYPANSECHLRCGRSEDLCQWADYFEGTLEEKDSPLAALHGIQKCFITI